VACLPLWGLSNGDGDPEAFAALTWSADDRTPRYTPDVARWPLNPHQGRPITIAPLPGAVLPIEAVGPIGIAEGLALAVRDHLEIRVSYAKVPLYDRPELTPSTVRRLGRLVWTKDGRGVVCTDLDLDQPRTFLVGRIVALELPAAPTWSPELGGYAPLAPVAA
jgi:hypothetical protein